MVLSCLFVSCRSVAILGILCAWTTMQMPRGSCWPPFVVLGRPRITWLSTIQQDLKHHHLTLPKAADLAQNRPLWRMMSMYGATQSWVACQKRRRYYCMVGKNSSNSIPSILYMAGKNQRIFTCHTLVWKRIACCVFSLFCLVTDISATVAPVSMKLYHWGSPNHKFWA